MTKRTQLYDFLSDKNPKFVPFAGYEMPVQFPSGIIFEHLHTRSEAGFFDISHMGQILVSGENLVSQLEAILPIDVASLGIKKQKYALLLDDRGGILDDLMVARLNENSYMLVVNASCVEQDFLHIKSHLSGDVDCVLQTHRSLVALQGPKSEMVLQKIGLDVSNMFFMDVQSFLFQGNELIISRSGYTGEDGFEISVPNNTVVDLASQITQHQEVQCIGLGARDSLRLEAGLCLYGHDMSIDTSPIEANLLWSISASRRKNGVRAGGFPGASMILEEIENGCSRKLLKFIPEGRAPVREKTKIVTEDGKSVGIITSGLFSPSLGHPISMGYLETEFQTKPIYANLRGRLIPLRIQKKSFVENKYRRKQNL